MSVRSFLGARSGYILKLRRSNFGYKPGRQKPSKSGVIVELPPSQSHGLLNHPRYYNAEQDQSLRRLPCALTILGAAARRATTLLLENYVELCETRAARAASRQAACADARDAAAALANREAADARGRAPARIVMGIGVAHSGTEHSFSEHT